MYEDNKWMIVSYISIAKYIASYNSYKTNLLVLRVFHECWLANYSYTNSGMQASYSQV